LAEPLSSERLPFANELRGVAAISVMAFHYFGLFWTQPSVAADLVNAPPAVIGTGLGPLTTLFAPGPLFSFGHFGVALFFLISGFVIPFAIRRQTRLGFVIARTMRLWPTYATGLTVSLVALWMSGAVWGRAFPYGISPILWHYALGLRDLAGSPNIDGIVWTLEVEVRFYLLCLVFAPSLRAGRFSGVCLASMLVAATTLILDQTLHVGLPIGPGLAGVLSVCGLDGEILVYMLLGTLLYLYVRGYVTRRTLAASMLAGAVVFAGLCSRGPLSTQLPAVLISYGSALLLFLICLWQRARLRGNGILGWMADISYPLYVIHAVPGYALMRIALAAGLSPGLCVMLAVVCALGCATIIHRFVEVRTRDAGRRWAAAHRTGLAVALSSSGR
jgi:peptidoglycan/LPS O-acetylase OafA/YrhL